MRVAVSFCNTARNAFRRHGTRHLWREGAVRHHAVGQACPMDGAVVTRSHCAPCPSFVSFRISVDVATIGCTWGDDMAGWLRQEMGRRDRNLPVRRAMGRPQRPAPPRRSGTSLVAGASFGLFLAAFGFGLAMSAFEKPS